MIIYIYTPLVIRWRDVVAMWPGLLPEMILKGWFSIPLVNMSLGSSKNRFIQWYLPTIGLFNVYPMFIMVYPMVFSNGFFNGLLIPDEIKIN